MRTDRATLISQVRKLYHVELVTVSAGISIEQTRSYSKNHLVAKSQRFVSGKLLTNRTMENLQLKCLLNDLEDDYLQFNYSVHGIAIILNTTIFC